MIGNLSWAVWGLVVLVGLLMFATRGCGSRFEKFQERREEFREDRQERQSERWDSWKERDRMFGRRKQGE